MAHKFGTGHEFNHEEAVAAGRKGGAARAKKRELERQQNEGRN